MKRNKVSVVSAAILLSMTLSGCGAMVEQGYVPENPFKLGKAEAAKVSPVVEFSKEQNPELLFSIFDESIAAANFKSLDTIMPYNVINTDRKITELKSKSKDLSGVTYKFEGSTYKLDDLLSKTATTGLVVLKDGKIANEQYFQGYDKTSHATSWSVAKSFLSVLVGIAIEDKKIKSVDDQITKYIPELKGSGYDGVTIKQVLEMSSGVKFNEDYSDMESDINYLMPYMVLDNGSIDDYVTTLVREDAPGTHKYKSIDTQVLGLLLKKATGVPASKYLEDKLWQPLQMTSPAFWNTDLNGNEISFAMLNATLRDYAKFGELVLNDGKYNGKQIVSKSWIKQSVTPSRKELYPGTADPYFGYGYQWWIPSGAKYGEEFSAIGIYGQYIYVNKKEDVVIVKTSADQGVIMNDAETIEAFRAIAKKL